MVPVPKASSFLHQDPVLITPASSVLSYPYRRLRQRARAVDSSVIEDPFHCRQPLPCLRDRRRSYRLREAIGFLLVRRAPAGFSLGLIMLAMGITLELKDLFGLFRQRHLSILFGCLAQYTIMPAFGAIVTLIAKRDVALSIVMTVCTTLAAVLLTPILTKVLAGTYVPVDAMKFSISTLQVVVAPILLGSYLQSTFPAMVKVVTPFAPLIAVLTSSLLASSVFSENVIRFRSSIIDASSGSDPGSLLRIQDILSGDFGASIVSVLLLHFAGFFVGYLSAYLCGFKERQ